MVVSVDVKPGFWNGDLIKGRSDQNVVEAGVSSVGGDHPDIVDDWVVCLTDGEGIFYGWME